jgi:hypothetical protein
MTENELAPLELYLGFNSMPASQVGDIMAVLSNLYALLSDPVAPLKYYDVDMHPRLYGLNWHFRNRHSNSQLCLDFARSGNSVTFRFSGRSAFPAIKIDGENIEIEVPVTWTAAALGVGALILGVGCSQKIYNQYLDSQIKTSQVRSENFRGDLLRAEIDNMKALTEEIHQRINDSTRRPSPSTRSERKKQVIINNVNMFRDVISTENITVVSVNGLPVEQASRDSHGEFGPETP